MKKTALLTISAILLTLVAACGNGGNDAPPTNTGNANGNSPPPLVDVPPNDDTPTVEPVDGVFVPTWNEQDVRIEADAVWRDFLDAFEFLDGNEEYEGFFFWYNAPLLMDFYNEQDSGLLERHTRLSADDWDSFSDYEKFLYRASFLAIAEIFEMSDYTRYDAFNSELDMFAYSGGYGRIKYDLIGNQYRDAQLRGVDDAVRQSMIDALDALIAFQHGLITTYGTVYDFMDGGTYYDTVGGVIDFGVSGR